VIAGSQSGTRVHVLVIVALQDELEGLKAVAAGAWKQHEDSAGFPYHVREFTHASGGVLRVAVARLVDMGGASASNVATRLVKELEPVCLAMSGICAGRRSEVSLGDVIVASRLFDAEAGKLKATTTAGKRVEEMSHATTTFNLDPRWQQRAEDWPRAWCAPWQAQRPRTLAAQGDWLLDALRRHEKGQGEGPEEHPERHTRCPSWKKVIVRLRKRGLATRVGLKLTKKGREYVDEQWLLFGNRMPDETPLRVHVGPMGTVGNVKEDPELFGKLLRVQRKLKAVDMESVAIGLVAALEQVRFTLVVKAVQDYADDDKDDSLRDFGTRVAAAFLLDFLRENLPADVLVPQPATLKDRLGSGQAELRSVATPATYLVARHQVVPFAGRADELAILDTWAGSDDAVRVLLVHGPAGMGKTRLLTEWLARHAARHPGDAIGFMTGALDDAAIDALCASERTVVVIDYAEERAGLDTLLGRMGELAMQRESGRHVRLVLLARNAGDWWASLRGRSSDMAALLGEPPLELEPLTAATQDARLAEYRRAHAALVQALQRRPVDARPAIAIVTHLDAEPDLRARHFERPLFVHMAALTAVLGKPQAGSSRDIVDEILGHEQRYWARYLAIEPDGDEWRKRVEQVRQVAAALVVRGACAREDLSAVMQTLGLPDDDRIRALLQDLYPAPDPARSRAWVVSVEPDLVAEALLCSVLERRGRPEEWLVKALTSIKPRHWTHAFTVLGRMGVGHDDAMASVGTGAARALLCGDVTGRAEAAFDAALALTEHTAHSDLGRILADALSDTEHVAVARALDGRVPQRTVSLRELAVRVDEILLASLGETGEPEERAWRHNNLGNRYSELGRREEALAATQRAVKIDEELADKRPDAFLPNLAMSLSNLGNRYSELGRREEALLAIEQALKRNEELAVKRPDAFLPNLALSLNNLGAMYSELGRREEALAATQRAVEIREELAAKRPDAFLPNLAVSLNNLGGRYNELGRREEALAATQRAVKLYEELAAKRPDAFLPDLARSLNNLGVIHSGLERREEALAATQRAVKLYEELAAKRSDAFLPDLALSLNNLGVMHAELGRREEAQVATERAVTLYEELAAKRPDAFLPDLARSLAVRSKVHSSLGHEALARDIVTAVGHLWPYFERQPATFAALMGAMLRDYVDYLDGAEPDETMAWRRRRYTELIE
jgi:tetratricopeptide (TPR) repeat protein/nucleoside phosphorylase